MRMRAPILALAAALATGLLAPHARAQKSSPACSPPPIAAATVSRLVAVFRAGGQPLWPGYDLSRQPFLVYGPDWALLVNPRGVPPGFEAATLPGDIDAARHCGALPGLAGQLAFDYQLGDDTVAAIPLTADLPPVYALGFVVHEAFHQFQHAHFAEEDEPSEEAYPILDAENSARAALELRILADAAARLARGDTVGARQSARAFLAARAARWRAAARARNDVRAFERMEERIEGTAFYVQVRAIARLSGLCRTRADDEACPAFLAVNGGKYLRRDLASRLHDGTLGPEDVARNRIYPVGAVEALLLDGLAPRWKQQAMQVDSFTLSDRLAAALAPGGDPAQRMAQAERRYDYPAILAASRRLARQYRAQADSALAAFARASGARVEVEMPASGTSRSRMSRSRSWVLDAGARVFSPRYIVYALRRTSPDSIFFRAHNLALLDERLAGGRRRVVFHSPALTELVVDGEPLNPAGIAERRFHTLRLRGSDFALDAAAPGTLERTADALVVRF